MAEINYVDFHVTPFRADRFLDIWAPAAERTLAFGAKSWSLTRSIDDPLHIRQSSLWEERDDFERYWFSDEISAIREEAVDYYSLPLLPTWHAVLDHS
jgi:quinol monooxygenase YgiN